MLAKYGNKATYTKQATAQSAGYTNYAVHGQVHFFGLPSAPYASEYLRGRVLLSPP